MSLQQAMDEIRTRLNAIAGMAEIVDLRDESLENTSKSNLDGAYNLRILSTGNPWPDLALSPVSWWASIEMEVGSIIANDHVATAIAEATRTHAIRKALQFNQLIYATVWGFEEPIVQIAVTNPRLRIWRWRWRLRYEE